MPNRKRKQSDGPMTLRGKGAIPTTVAQALVVCKVPVDEADWHATGRPNWFVRYSIADGTGGIAGYKYSKTMIPAMMVGEVICIMPLGTVRVELGTTLNGTVVYGDTSWESVTHMEAAREKIKRGASYGPRVTTWGSDLTEETAQTFSVPDDGARPGPAPRIVKPVLNGKKVVDWEEPYPKGSHYSESDS